MLKSFPMVLLDSIPLQGSSLSRSYICRCHLTIRVLKLKRKRRENIGNLEIEPLSLHDAEPSDHVEMEELEGNG